MIRRAVAAALVSALWTGIGEAQTDSPASGCPLAFQVLYTGDWMHNLAGGIRTGSGYLGMANLCLEFDLGRARLVHGGTVFLKGSQTHGATPSVTLLGDFQVVSNLEAGTHTYVQELWYRQSIGTLDVTVGLQDMNVRFASNLHSGAYLNSSFGVPATISHNTPVPIFPLTSPGIMVAWNVWDRCVWQAALYDGRAGSFASNPRNMKWHLGADDGAFAITEIQYSFGAAEGLEGTYKVGVYEHTGWTSGETAAGMPGTSGSYLGLYAIADQMIKGGMDEPGSIAVFGRAGLSPQHTTPNTAFCGAGINCYGLFGGGRDEVLGAAFALTVMEHTDDETAVELTYRRRLTEFLFLQPDFQYIIHPSGTGVVLANCAAATLRFGVIL